MHPVLHSAVTRALALAAALAALTAAPACVKDASDQPIPVDSATRRYVGKSVQECATIRFVCNPGEQYFSDDRGCGCEGEGQTAEAEPVEAPEPDALQAAAPEHVKRYVGHSEDECARIRFRCDPGLEYFADKQGCGCTGVATEKAPGAIEPEAPAEQDAVRCTEDSRKAEVCAEIYDPVCGLFDPQKMQCIKAPCGQTYSNDCDACRDPDVIAYLKGECK